MIPRFRPWIGLGELIAAFRPGPEPVRQFEEEFAKCFGAPEALSFSYGRVALWAFLQAVEVKDSEVLIPAYTCSVVAHAVTLSGNEPKFVDVDAGTYNMSFEAFEAAITERTRAVIPTHLFGRPMDTHRLAEIVRSAEERYGHRIWVIQDCAHSFGAAHDGEDVCRFGDAALYALNISKVMTAIFGGMMTINDPDVSARVREWRDRELRKPGLRKSWLRRIYLLASTVAFSRPIYGLTWFLQHRTNALGQLTDAYHLDERIHFPPDYRDQMTAVEAAVGRVQLRRYRENIRRRRSTAQIYMDLLDGVEGLRIPSQIEGHTYSHFVIAVENRPEYVRLMAQKGIELGELIQYSVPETGPYRGSAFPAPVSGVASHSLINLPVDPAVTERVARRVAMSLLDVHATLRVPGVNPKAS